MKFFKKTPFFSRKSSNFVANYEAKRPYISVFFHIIFRNVLTISILYKM